MSTLSDKAKELALAHKVGTDGLVHGDVDVIADAEALGFLWGTTYSTAPNEELANRAREAFEKGRQIGESAGTFVHLMSQQHGGA